MVVKVSSLIFDRKNGLTICRLFLSVCVTISHSYPLSGYTNEIGRWLTFGQDSLGSFAVKSFMAISGFLILPSLYRNNLNIFFTKIKIQNLIFNQRIKSYDLIQVVELKLFAYFLILF